MKVNSYGRWLVAALLLGVILTWASAQLYAADVLTEDAPTGPAGSESDPDPIALAREHVAADPGNGAVYLDLARVLGSAIQQDTAANGPRYSFEMLGALEKAIELEPELEEAYHWLVGYYTNAPAIAGGSIDKAVKTARQLESFNPTRGKALLAQIEAGQAGSE